LAGDDSANVSMGARSMSGVVCSDRRLFNLSAIQWWRCSGAPQLVASVNYSAAATIWNGFIGPSSAVRDLGVFIDADLSMRTHVQRTIASCFAVLRQLRSIGRSVPFINRWLLHSCCLNFNATLADWPVFRSVYSVVFSLFSMPLLGWLPVFVDLTTSQTRPQERVKLKLAVIV